MLSRGSSAAFARSLCSEARGYWGLWEDQQRERRRAWEEARERNASAQDAERLEWARLRRAWATLSESDKANAGESQQSSRSRVTWWWEEPTNGTRRATAEDAAAFSRRHRDFEDGKTPPMRRQPSDARGLYAALGLRTSAERRCSALDLRAAFQRTALANHPDTAQQAATPDVLASRFRQAKEAFDLLRDPLKRERYDAGG